LTDLPAPLTDLRFSRPHKTLDDRELDSGDDEGRYDRMDLEDMEDGADGETLKVMDLNLARAPEPQSSTGEVRLWHVFLRV
jgi:RNA polymerase-associated protein LEO1